MILTEAFRRRGGFVLKIMILLSLLGAQTAMAFTPEEIRALRDQSLRQARVEAGEDHLTRIGFEKEINLLLLDLKAKQNLMRTNEHIEQVSVVISAALASFLGYVVFKPTTSGSFGNRTLMDIGERLIVGSVTTIGMVTSAGTAGLVAYRTSLTPAQINQLRQKLLSAKSILIQMDEAR